VGVDVEPIPPEYEPSFMLYRAALVQCRAAARFRLSHRLHRQLQEADSCATAVVLTMASLESWIHSAWRPFEKEMGSRQGWLDLWRPEAVAHLRRLRGHAISEVVVPAETTMKYLDYMKDLRNYLVHGDLKSQKRITKWFSLEPDRLLQVHVAETATADADELFRYGMAATGILAPSRLRILETHPGLLD
jgi:hypothetical protein